MRLIRRAWRCDCDGESHRGDEDVDGHKDAVGFRAATLGAIERITGHRPVTCPWRAFYDPLVREVLDVLWSAEDGNLGAVLGPDPPGVVVDAIGVFKRALAATQAEDARLEREQREQKRKAAEAARRG